MRRKPFLIGVLVGLCAGVALMGMIRVVGEHKSKVVVLPPLTATIPPSSLTSLEPSVATTLMLAENVAPAEVRAAARPPIPLPKGSVQEEINGLPYYIIPLE